MLGCDWFEGIADRTGLPPGISSEFTSRVDSLVIGIGEELEVFEPVILLVSIGVVEGVAFWDWSISLSPDVDVLEDESSINNFSEVSFCCDVPTVWSCWYWSSFTHEDSLTV